MRYSCRLFVMATHQKYQSPIDRIEKIVVSEKLSASKLEDIFTDFESDQIREWISALETFVEVYEEAKDTFERWQYAEDREEKSEAREELLEQLQQVINETLMFTELPEIPELGLTPVEEAEVEE